MVERYIFSSMASLFLVGTGCMVGTIDSPPGSDQPREEEQPREEPGGDDHSWEVQFFDSNADGTIDAVDTDGDSVIDYYFDYASCSSCMSAGVSSLAVCTRPIVDQDGDGLPEGLDFDCDGVIDVELFDFCDDFPFCDSGDDNGGNGDGWPGEGGGNNGEDGTGGAGEDGTSNESGNGGISSVSICSVSVSINGQYMAVSCEQRNDGVNLCTCEDGSQVYTCETSSDSACSIPNGNCCGFVL